MCTPPSSSEHAKAKPAQATAAAARVVALLHAPVPPLLLLLGVGAHPAGRAVARRGSVTVGRPLVIAVLLRDHRKGADNTVVE